MSDKKLLFENPEFRYGEVNVTVRMGDKWAKAGLEPSNVVELVCTLNGESYGSATWCGCMVLSIEQLGVAAPVLQLEHDPACMTFEGIVAELCEVYGMDCIEADAVVTVCFFIPHGYNPGEEETKRAA